MPASSAFQSRFSVKLPFEVHQHSGAVEPKSAFRLTLFRLGLNGRNRDGDRVLCWVRRSRQ